MLLDWLSLSLEVLVGLCRDGLLLLDLFEGLFDFAGLFLDEGDDPSILGSSCCWISNKLANVFGNLSFILGSRIFF